MMKRMVLFLSIVVGEAHAVNNTYVGLGNNSPFTDSSGVTWAADNGCNGGVQNSTTTAITGSGITQVVYQHNRTAPVGFSCSYVVSPAAYYNVTLKFANITSLNIGQYVFNIYINNVLRAANVDIAVLSSARPGTPGQFIAADLGYTIPVDATGMVNITLIPTNGGAMLNGISIVPLYGILGTAPGMFSQTFFSITPPNLATLNTLYNGAQFDMGGYPSNFQNGFTTSPTQQALVGSINAVTSPPATVNTFGVAGYGRTAFQTANAVGVYGSGTCAGSLTQCWGSNFDVQHDTNGVAGGAMVAGEFDVGHSATGGLQAATLKGVTSVLLAITAPTGFAHAYEALRDGPTHFQWNAGFQANAGCCNVAFIASPTHETNNSVPSAPIQLIGRDAGGTTHTATLQADLSGNLSVQAATNQTITLGPGPTATSVAFNSSGASVMSTTGSIIVGQISASTIMFAIDTGANNAIAGTVANPPALANGLRISVFLTHTLQIGANTFAYNGGAAVAIKSHRNTANNIAVGYTNGIIDLIYDGTQWEDLSQ